MKIANFSIKHPIIIVVVAITALIFGTVALLNINTDLFPDISLPSVAVFTYCKGIGPKDVEEEVVKPIENVISGLAGVKKIESTSQEGVGVVFVSYDWGKNLSEATVELREALNQIADKLPEEADIPKMIQFSASNIPICTFTISGKMPVNDVAELFKNEIQSKIQRVTGVSQVEMFGGDAKIVDIAVNLTLLESKGISILDIMKRFRYENVNFPAGSMVLNKKDFIIRTVGEFKSLDDIKNITIGYKDGAFIFLKDVANVKFGYEGQRAYGFDKNAPCLFVEVYKQSGKNTVRVLKRLKKEIKDIEVSYSNKIKFSYISDQSKEIANSLNSVTNSALYGGILAIIILFLFLGNMRTTLIIGFSIPFSIISTFFLMRTFGLTINLMTMGGLSLGVGMLVDNAIVVLENIFRHYSKGMNKLEASKFGANEVGGAILASTLTTLAVFIPLISVEGIAGIIFRDLAKTISFALFMSLISALTIIPLLTSRFLKHNIMLEEKKDKFILFKLFEVFLEKIENIYAKIINFALDKKLLIIFLALAIFILTFPLVSLLGFIFLPDMDQGQVNISITLPMGTPLEKTKNVTEKITSLIKKNIPELDNFMAIYGFGGSEVYGGTGRATNNGYITVRLVPPEKRKRTIWQIVSALRNEIDNNVPGIKYFIYLGGLSTYVTVAAGANANIQIGVTGDKIDDIYEAADTIKNELSKLEGVRGPRLSINFGVPEMQLQVNKKDANTLGLTTYQIALATRIALNGMSVSKFRTKDKEYDIWLRLREQDRKSFDSLSRIFLKNPNDTLISLNAVTDVVKGKSPSKIKRLNKQKIITVMANNENRNANEIIDELMNKLKSIKFKKDIKYEAAGTNKEMKASFNSLKIALLLAVLLVFVVMAIQFESFLHPLIVMFSIPFSFVGVILGLAIGGSEFSVIAFLGIIMLAGIVVNNAIVLIDYINIQIRSGQELREAILTATKTRLRPILMTTLTTVLGLMPMALSLGSGSEMYKPLGQAVIGGLLTSTLITLVLIPVIYYSVENLKSKTITLWKKSVKDSTSK